MSGSPLLRHHGGLSVNGFARVERGRYVARHRKAGREKGGMREEGCEVASTHRRTARCFCLLPAVSVSMGR